jgi:cation:H+ antiporter
MITAATATLPIFFTGYRIPRWEAAVFLGYYIAYVGYLILAATDRGLTTRPGDSITWFVRPLTVLTIGISLVHQRRRSATPLR